MGINNKLFAATPFVFYAAQGISPRWLTRTEIVNFNNENARARYYSIMSSRYLNETKKGGEKIKKKGKEVPQVLHVLILIRVPFCFP